MKIRILLPAILAMILFTACTEPSNNGEITIIANLELYDYTDPGKGLEIAIIENIQFSGDIYYGTRLQADIATITHGLNTYNLVWDSFWEEYSIEGTGLILVPEESYTINLEIGNRVCLQTIMMPPKVEATGPSGSGYDAGTAIPVTWEITTAYPTYIHHHNSITIDGLDTVSENNYTANYSADTLSCTIPPNTVEPDGYASVIVSTENQIPSLGNDFSSYSYISAKYTDYIGFSTDP